MIDIVLSATDVSDKLAASVFMYSEEPETRDSQLLQNLSDYLSTWRRMPEGSNVYRHICENLRLAKYTWRDEQQLFQNTRNDKDIVVIKNGVNHLQHSDNYPIFATCFSLKVLCSLLYNVRAGHPLWFL
jgi:hypothetical protein